MYKAAQFKLYSVAGRQLIIIIIIIIIIVYFQTQGP